MAYLGRKGAVAPLTSGDIPDGVIEGRDIAFFENASGQDLSGTYSTERMYLAGRTGSAPKDYNYKLVGNIDVTGHLALGTIADDDVIITQDSTERTITGSGTLESGDLLHRGEDSTDLTGMTGELGSVVTGSPNLNLTTGTLGSGVTFPAGHVLQVVTDTYSTENNVSITTSWRTTNLGATITPTSASSEILVLVSNGAVYLNTSGVTCIQTVFRGGTLTAHTAATGTNIGHASYGLTATYFGNAYPQFLPMHCSHLDSPNTTSATNYTVCFQIPSGAMTVYYCYANNLSSITLMEIAG